MSLPTAWQTLPETVSRKVFFGPWSEKVFVPWLLGSVALDLLWGRAAWAEHHGRGFPLCGRWEAETGGTQEGRVPRDTTQWPAFTIKTKFPNHWTCRALQKTQTQRWHGTLPPLPYSPPYHLSNQVLCIRVSLRFWVPLANQTHPVGCWKLGLWLAGQTAWD